MNPNTSLFVTIFINFIIISLGYVVYKRNKKILINKTFFLFTTFFVIWSTFNFLETWVENIDLVKLFIKLDFTFAPITIFFLSFFLFNFPDTNKRLESFYGKIYFSLPLFLIFIFSLTDQVVGDIKFVDNIIRFNFGPMYPIYGFIIAIYVIWPLILLILKYKKYIGIKKLQTLYIILGFSSTFIILLICNLFLQNKISVEVFRLSNNSSIILVLCMTYAIVRYRLMDIRLF
ncbi:MAG: histidine kinase N-terminal 7TM domain-containing protein [Patescibacteria group bacterium]